MQIDEFSFFHSIVAGFWARQTSCPIRTGDISPEVKRQGREPDDTHTSNASVKNGGTIYPLLRTCPRNDA
jgi:hypothetical protein